MNESSVHTNQLRQLRLAIDGNEANVTQPVGSNVYAQKVLQQLEKNTRQPQSSNHCLFQISVTVLLSTPATKALPKPRPGWSYQVVGPKKLWTQFGLPIYLFQHQRHFDVFFTPSHYAPRLCPIPYVSSVMDVAFLEYPNQFKKSDLIQLTNWTEYSVKHAKKVIAISKATLRDVVKYYHRSSKDIVVAYPALPTQVPSTNKLLSATELERKFGVTAPYLIYVGTFQPRKNVTKLVAAFEKVRRLQASSEVSRVSGKNTTQLKSKKNKNTALQLVLVGKTGWLAQPILDRVAASPFVNDIILTGYVTELEKASLLSRATASVLVGLKEGFGIPPLESMAMGTPPVVSKTSSLPEVVGSAGFLVDPNSVSSIANGLYKATQLTAKGRAMYQRKMRTQLKKFSWTQTAHLILNTLIEVSQS